MTVIDVVVLFVLATLVGALLLATYRDANHSTRAVQLERDLESLHKARQIRQLTSAARREMQRYYHQHHGLDP